MNKNSKEIEIYDIFHDECKEDGFWHCFIFLPRKKQGELFNLLQIPRRNLNYSGFIHFSDIGHNCKSYYKKPLLIKSWSTIFLYAIQQQKIHAELDLGYKNKKPNYQLRQGVDAKIGAKLVVLRIKKLQDMYNQMSINKKIETTFLMGIKGGSNFLFFDEEVKIGKIYIDSLKEILEKNFNTQNILKRFKSEVNKNISFNDDVEIIPIYKKNYKKNGPVSEFMQLADVVIGAIRTQKREMKNFPVRYEITKPFKDLLKKDMKNIARMRNSKYYKGFALSDACIENKEWKFENMDIGVKQNKCQNLPFD